MAKEQVYWDDVEEGSEIPPLEKIADRLMLVRWAGASGDFNPHHYDDTFAATQGTDGVIVHGLLKHAWLIQLLSDWIGDEGFLKKFDCQYRGMDHPRVMKSMSEHADEGDTWKCFGKVVKKYIEEGNHCVDLEIGIESAVQGKVTTPGTATVILPKKS